MRCEGGLATEREVCGCGCVVVSVWQSANGKKDDMPRRSGRVCCGMQCYMQRGSGRWTTNNGDDSNGGNWDEDAGAEDGQSLSLRCFEDTVVDSDTQGPAARPEQRRIGVIWEHFRYHVSAAAGRPPTTCMSWPARLHGQMMT